MADNIAKEAPYLAPNIGSRPIPPLPDNEVSRSILDFSAPENAKNDRETPCPRTSSAEPPPRPDLLKRFKAGDTMDDYDIDDLPEDLAKVLYPQSSTVAFGEELPVLSKAWTGKGQIAFLAKYMSKKICDMVNKKFGKPSLNHCFKSEATLRHVLPLLFATGFLSVDDTAFRANFTAALPEYQTFFDLYEEHKDIDFNDLRIPRRMDVPPEESIDPLRVRKVTAALMYFNGNVADFVRWLGGLHTGSFRNTEAVLSFLRGKIDDDVHDQLHRIWTLGIPQHCNAESSEANFQAFYQYGNHSTVTQAAEKMLKTLTKDANLDQVLVFDERLVPYLVNCHVTPQGLVNVDQPGKKPRGVFDSTFRPTFWAVAINDMTNKDTEPIIREINTEIKLMKWFWALRAFYPDQEIYPMDDDGRLAFRQLKYHPDLVALHTSRQCGFGVCNTGGTFGDNTTPSNYDVFSTARRQLAQWLWVHDPHVIARVQHLLPPVTIAPPPSSQVTQTFTPAEFDSLNPAPVLPDGDRAPPPYNHQVDDNLYGDVAPHLHRTLACSALALYIILGFPGPYIPDLLSKDKLDTSYTHERTMVGRYWNTRTMQVGMLPTKRALLIDAVREWTKPGKAFTLVEAATLLGQLENHTRYVRWAKSWMAVLYNEFRQLMTRTYHVLKRRWSNNPRLERHYAAMAKALPTNLKFRLNGCIAKDKAAFLWRSKSTAAVSPTLGSTLQLLLHYLQRTEYPWTEYIGFIIPRDPHMESLGDASGVAGGAFCSKLRFWFQIIWGPDIRRRATAPMKDPTRLQINCLEFVVVILQLAATITWIESIPRDQILGTFPQGIPHLPILSTGSDNQVAKAWANKGFTSSPAGQQLLVVYTDILRDHKIGHDVFYIPGEENTVADDISRPTDDPSDNLLSNFPALLSQTYQRNPFLQTFSSFHPSPELLRRISSALYTTAKLVPASMTGALGHFEPAGSIGSTLLM